MALRCKLPRHHGIRLAGHQIVDPGQGQFAAAVAAPRGDLQTLDDGKRKVDIADILMALGGFVGAVMPH